MDLPSLNQLTDDSAAAQLLQCCGSTRWAHGVATGRPYDDFDELAQTSDDLWWQLDEADWLEAFKAHPRIGEQKAETTGTAQSQSWSANEQQSMSSASDETTEKLARLNREYEAKFGYIFIVCATGKTSAEMLALLEERLANDAIEELSIAASEQAKITRLRLEKLLSASGQ